MKKTATLLSTAAAMTALIATPVLAKDNSKPKASHTKALKAQHISHQSQMRHANARLARHNELNNQWNRRGTGFWPVDVAGGIVGGAVGTAGAIATGAVHTAGAIATAPFGGPYHGNRDYYAATYDNRGYNNRGYYASNAGYYRNAGYYGRDVSGYPYGNRYRYGNTYASADMAGWNGGYARYAYNGISYPASANYDARNGFTCRPGTVTKLANGQPVICQ